MAADIPAVTTPTGAWQNSPSTATPVTAAELNERDTATRAIITALNTGDVPDGFLTALADPATELGGAIAAAAASDAEPIPGPSVIRDDVTAQRWDTARPLTSSPTIAVKGHSWVYSDNGLLQASIANLTGVTVRNLGIGGQTSTEIAIRTGGIVPLLTLTGNSIPAATTPVTVTAIRPTRDYRTNGSSAYTYAGTLAGIPGTLTETLQSTGNPVWTFSRTTAGTATPVPPDSPFLVSSTTYQDETTVIMCAQNNLYSTDTTMRSVIRDIDAMIGALTPAQPRYLVVGEFTYPTDTIDATGGLLTRRTKMLDINAARAARYGSNFYDQRRDLIDLGLVLAGVTPTPDDIDKVRRDSTPLGILKSEADTHPSAAGYAVLGKLVAKELVRRGFAVYSGAAHPEVPGSPAAVGGAGQATISYTAPANGGSAVTTYVAQYRLVGQERWQTFFAAATTSTSIPVTGLTAGSYQLRVAAINATGPSDWSAATSAVVVTASADTTAPTAPTTVTATAGDGSATVTFSGAADNVGVTGYRVTASTDSFSAVVATGAASPITVTGLTNGAAVSFRVAARDAAGNWSTQSATSNTVTPTALTVLTSDTFNRADGALTGNTDAAAGGTPREWTTGGSVAIISNQLGRSAASGTSTNHLDVGQSDHRITIRVAVLQEASGMSIVCRYADTSNYYRLIVQVTGALSLNKTVAGANTGVGAPAPSGTVVNGDVVGVGITGSTLRVYRNGAVIGTYSDADIAAGTRVGLILPASTVVRLDDLLVTAEPATP